MLSHLIFYYIYFFYLIGFGKSLLGMFLWFVIFLLWLAKTKIKSWLKIIYYIKWNNSNEELKMNIRIRLRQNVDKCSKLEVDYANDNGSWVKRFNYFNYKDKGLDLVTRSLLQDKDAFITPLFLLLFYNNCTIGNICLSTISSYYLFIAYFLANILFK